MRFATAAGDGCIAACRAVRRTRAATPVRVSCCLVRAYGFPDMAEASDKLRGRQILPCVCGGIAAYQATELVRRPRDAGATVQLALPAGALHFARPPPSQHAPGP